MQRYTIEMETALLCQLKNKSDKLTININKKKWEMILNVGLELATILKTCNKL
jgi:hypothetical protein